MSVLSVIRKLKSRIAKELYKGNYRPGHYYSPIPDIAEVKVNESSIFTDSICDINLNEPEQLSLLKNCISHYSKYSFPSDFKDGFRYYSNNPFFNRADSLGLFFILNQYLPKSVIEVGSGFSSACMLDTIERHLPYKPEILFIEPYPERLRSLLSESDMQKYKLVQSRVQQIDVSVFSKLKADDLLFIDSSHVSKVGSDLNFLLFEVLPVLQSGVIIHFHDICYPFEYPKEWIYDGIYWNEAYLLRAFLMNNSAYEILLFNHFVAVKYKEWLAQHMPLFGSGGSLYLRKK